MSLFKFVERNLSECPELLLLSEPKNNMDYKGLFDFFKFRERKFPIQSYLDILLYDSICRCSQNVIEYDILKEKSNKISGLLQAKFDLNLSSQINKL